MRYATWCASLLGLALLLIMSAGSANAQATRTWVSGVGDDANPCSRTAPCKTFPGAISKTAAGGEIDCLDPGGFGAVTITKSISIICDFTDGGLLVAGTNAITVSALATDTITLKGLNIEGVGTGLVGINILSAAAVHIHKVQIRDFRGGNASGIMVANTSGTVQVFVADSYITDNGNSATSGGILVKPTGSGSVNLTVNRTQIEANRIGIRVDSSATTGTVRGLVRDSLVAGSANNGITAVSGATVSQLMVDHSSVVGNNFGIVVNGAAATINTTDSTVAANGTGLFVNGTGTLNTYHTNAVNNNTSDGAFTAFIPAE